MGLRLVVGPANAGKVERLLDGYLDSLEREPVLIVPNRSDVDRVERELLRRRPALIGGSIGTFDDLFRRLATNALPVLTDAQRALAVRRAVARSSLNGLGRSARFAGFADALRGTLGELESGLLEPEHVGGDLGRLYRAYRDELERVGRCDRDLIGREAAERLAADLDAWNGQPVFAYGFEDLTGAEWELLQALAGRADVTVSLPYEPGRPAFASLTRTADDLSRLADEIEELPPRFGEVAQPGLAELERALFAEGEQPALESRGAVRFLEAAGTRGLLELVGEELLELIRGGVRAERIGVVCPSLERWRAPLETAFATLDVPFVFDGHGRLGQTPFGRALISLLRFAWLDGERGDLFAYLRSPYSGLTRHAVDFVEGRLRGRAVRMPERVIEEAERLRGAPLPALDALRAAEDPTDAVRSLATTMLKNAYGLEAPPVGEGSAADLRGFETAFRLLGELETWRGLDGELTREEVVGALERASVRLGRGDEEGRVAILDLLRARTRRFDVLFVLGLEEGSLPRRGDASPFLDEDARRELDSRGARLQRPDPVARDRYLFYTACTRASERLYLVREAATDEGSPREASPFWDEARVLFEDAERWTRRRSLSHLTWPLEQAPTERERLRGLARIAADDAGAAEALARANGWERRLDRALAAFKRPTHIRHPLVLEQLRARTTFNVTELERFADCSSAWFVDRVLEPKEIDPEVDAKLRGSVCHSALYRFFSGLPKELGADAVDAARLDDALRFMRRCLDDALDGVRMEMTELQRRELDQSLWRDLERLVREEAESELPFVPRRFEVLFGSERAAPELQRGLQLDGIRLSGKIDRIDVEPLSARGIVQDYKSGKSAHSAREIEKELRLQIPLYMLVLRDLVGVEPLGGLYRPLAGGRKPRGLLRDQAREDMPGFVKSDYLSEEDFWRAVEGAQELARRLAGRIREGDVRHDPKGGECPSWCDLWPMCRVERA